MELIDHDFYIFLNDKTDKLSVVYRRKDNNYGLIDTKQNKIIKDNISIMIYYLFLLNNHENLL